VIFSPPNDASTLQPAGRVGLSSEKESDLFRRALTGDRGSFGHLVLATQDRLYSAILRIVGDREEARDLTQEAYVRALSGLDSFRGKARFTTWLYRIAINLAINQIRRVRRHRAFSLDAAPRTGGGRQAEELLRRLSEAEGLPHGRRETSSPVEQASAREHHQMVLTAMAALDAEFRAVLVMRDIEQLEYQEIAEVLDLPLGSVKSRLFRARCALREALAQPIPAEGGTNGQTGGAK
jgi:RNA polymerase sigma-70 factor, ECF subfamily